MGYFSNGSEADDYVARYCSRCAHSPNGDSVGCAVMDAHWEHNYEECNNPNSILHMLIPRGANGFNEQCRMFFEKPQ